MPTINDLFEKHKDEFEREKKGRSEDPPFEIPRDPERRPWSDFSRSLKEENVSILDDDEIARGRNLGELPWYASFGGIARLLGARKKLFVSSLLILGTALSFYAAKIPVTYNSTLHLYAPEKWDSISSRLPLLTNRVEFASFPLEFKVPLSLLSRRLRSDEARAWVVARFFETEKAAGDGTPLIPETVRAETIYAATSELLMVQGFANDPELASKVTHLYWQYLEREIKNLRSDQMAKIESWIAQNLLNYNQQIETFTGELAALSVNTTQTDKVYKLHSRFNETYTDTQLRKVTLQKEIGHLQSIADTKSMKDLLVSNDPELQEIGSIHLELSRRLETLPPEASQNERDVLTQQLSLQSKRAEALLTKRLENKRALLDQTVFDQRRFQQELGHIQGQEGQIRMASEQERELRRLLFDAQSQKKILENLKSQLNVESDMGQSILKTIQLPVPDPLSVHPKPILKYSLAILATLLLSFFFVILFQMISPVPVSHREKAKSQK